MKQRKILVIVAYAKNYKTSDFGRKKTGRYHLQAREDLAKITAQNVADLKLPVATRKQVLDSLFEKRFSSIPAARKAADKGGYDSHTHQEIAIRATKWRKLKSYTGAKKS